MNVQTKDKLIGCDLTPPTPKEDHTRCHNIQKSHEDTIDRLKKDIDGQMKKNDQELFNNLQVVKVLPNYSDIKPECRYKLKE